MCGLFGVVTVGDNFISRNDITQLIRLGQKAQRRGVDASGLVSVPDDKRIRVVKANHSFESMVKTRVGHELLKSAKVEKAVNGKPPPMSARNRNAPKITDGTSGRLTA